MRMLSLLVLSISASAYLQKSVKAKQNARPDVASVNRENI